MSDDTDSSPPSEPTEPPAIVWAERDPDEGARRLALGFLDQATAAQARLADREDTEALHDFRVGLRRLRSTLRTYQDLLAKSVGKKLAKRLKALADSTGEGRDAEVALAWLDAVAQSEEPPAPSARPGHRWLRSRLAAVRDRAYAEIAERIEEDFEPIAERLRERLSVYRAEVRLDATTVPRRLGEVAAAELSDLAARIEKELATIDSAADEENAHRARITAKRIRYLLEPFAEESSAARATVKRLKQLQEVLGELHDAHVLERTLAEAASEAGAERAHRLFDLALDSASPGDLTAARRRPLESGLVDLGRRNRARRDQLFAELSAWRGKTGPPRGQVRGETGLARDLARAAEELARS
ncbi:MAG TPA: CHAD domain-containing protein [Thermoanaerobaculia bacterium]|jgi:CHAD domain-containing protein|nr:CHAD domain-containing protein [Thermoanaerobaculia bacterium]